MRLQLIFLCTHGSSFQILQGVFWFDATFMGASLNILKLIQPASYICGNKPTLPDEAIVIATALCSLLHKLFCNMW